MYIYIHIYQSVQLVDDLLRSTEVAYRGDSCIRDLFKIDNRVICACLNLSCTLRR